MGIKKLSLLLSVLVLAACGGGNASSQTSSGSGVIIGESEPANSQSGGIIIGGNETTGSQGGLIINPPASSEQAPASSVNQATAFPSDQLLAYLSEMGVHDVRVPAYMDVQNYEYMVVTEGSLKAFSVIAYVADQNALSSALTKMTNTVTQCGFTVTNQTANNITYYIAFEPSQQLRVTYYGGSETVNGQIRYGLATQYYALNQSTPASSQGQQGSQEGEGGFPEQELLAYLSEIGVHDVQVPACLTANSYDIDTIVNNGFKSVTITGYFASADAATQAATALEANCNNLHYTVVSRTSGGATWKVATDSSNQLQLAFRASGSHLIMQYAKAS